MAFVFAKLDPAIHRNPKVRKAGRLGREVFIFALCVNADRGATGIIPADYLEPWFLADALQITEAEAKEGLDRAVVAKLIELCPDMSGRLSGWDDEEWGRSRGGSMTEAERKKAQRERDRAERAAKEKQPVTDVRTPCPDMSGRPDQSESEKESDTESEAEIGLAAKPPAKRSSRKRPAIRIPDDFAPDDTHRTFAQANALDLDAEVEAFRLHHEAKGSVFASWSAALSTWLRNAVKFRRSGPQGGGRRGGYGATAGSEVADLLSGIPSEEFHPNAPRKNR